MSVFAAVDLGASSGRVMTADSATLELREAHRFPNRPVRVAGTLHWDILGLYRAVLDGLRAARPVDGIGVDSWAVDYGLLDALGSLVGNPVHYRDERTAGAVQPPGLYAETGCQFLPINTIFQLGAEHRPASRLLLIPDLITYWLTGASGTELTNASTTGLLDPRTRDWSAKAFLLIGREPGLFAPLRRPGDLAGHLLPSASKETGYSAPVYTVGSHDTASAVAAVPAADENFAYISSGTWSLVGVELPEPILTPEAEAANFTNELGVDGQIRFLRNVMGLWLLEECRREWTVGLDALLAEAATLPRRSVVDATDPRFLPPGDMTARIAHACRETDQPEPETPAEFTRCVLDSLAEAYRSAIEDAARLSGRRVDVVHIVGGGARNTLLCQLTADACELPVIAGPIEATALGNILVQARAAGAIRGDLRELVRRTQPLRHFA
ncbi:rhamnulokinase [Amycolatopsis xylanica]|uniref:Rhamnulokinase n=1 Tax=Amycolatopsis xylanica TaxID=589385 RepID=A0A1H2T0G9_9PSEU|nr:rhamnulokinase family protein [Amycolatopsis xylanica]SDW37443.1 rhamnulokinase [Amycolatopsis xylanica]